MARDTWAFTSGMLHLLLGCQLNSNMAEQIPQMISTHMALRRRAYPASE
jgi:TetR/AcrR family acrAB operon transcriptional repressor